MTWADLASVQRDLATYIAKELDGDQRFARGVCSRAYYAAYALVTARLPAGTGFSHGWQNPAHRELRGLVNRIAGLSDSQRRAVRCALNRLRHRREDADYRPGITVDRSCAIHSLRDAASVFYELGGEWSDGQERHYPAGA